MSCLATERGQRSEHAQRDADDRRHVGAADHLHGRHAGPVAGFTATPPEAQNIKDHPEADNTDQVLGIDVDGNYYLNKQQIPYDQIAPRVNTIFTQPDRDDYILYIKADKNLPYEKVLDVMDVAMKNGVRVVAMIGEQKPNTVSTVPGDSKDAPPAPAGGGN